MPRKRQYWKIDQDKGVVIGKLYKAVDSRKPRDHPPRVILCTIEECLYKQTSRGKIKRSESEVTNYIDSLVDLKTKEYKEKQEQANKGQEETPKLKKLIQEYLDHCSAQRLQSKTLVHYAKSLDDYIQANGNYHIGTHDPKYVDKYILYLDKRGLANASVRTALMEVRIFFNWCYEHKEAIDKPIKVKIPEKEKTRPLVYTVEDLRWMNQKLKDLIAGTSHKGYKDGYMNMYRAFFMCVNTAMRNSEIRALELSNIDMKNGLIYIRSNEQYKVKGKKEDESVPINHHLYEFLLKDFEDRGDHQRVWYLSDRYGNLMYKDNQSLGRALKRRWQDRGVKDHKPLHGIRATVLSLTTVHGGIAVAQTLARHSDIRITMEHYQDKDLLPVKDTLNNLKILL